MQSVPKSHIPKNTYPEVNRISIIKINISKQRLCCLESGNVIADYPVSTSSFGIGNRYGSNKTPLGLHRIVSKIGRGAAIGMIFVKRRKTGKKANTDIGKAVTKGDLITTRILRLEGLEKGKNKGPGVDSYRRCIYIHGTPEEGLIGRPASHRCIRMKNKDIVELFDMVKRGDLVYIHR